MSLHISTSVITHYWQRKNWWTFGKVMGKKVHRLKCPVLCSTVQLNSQEIQHMVGRNCCNSIILRQPVTLTLSAGLTTISLLYYLLLLTGWLIPSATVWMLIMCRCFVMTSFFFFCCRCILSVIVFFFQCGHFPSVHQMTPESLIKYFRNRFILQSLAWQFASLNSAAEFLHTNISQGSVATCLRTGYLINILLLIHR